jgi:kynurenine formamidase
MGCIRVRSKLQIIDLSMEIHTGLVSFPRTMPAVITELESHRRHAEMFGVTKEKYGIDEVNNHFAIVMGDHTGTHIDSLWHGNPQSTIKADQIPLEYCIGDGVVLDMSSKKAGEEILVEDLRGALKKIGYQIKPRDIVLIRTDAATRYYDKPAYLTEHPGMTREGTLWLIDQGVKVMGIDAPTFDLPFNVMLKQGKIWPAHMVMREREYYHLENLINLDKIPKPFGFKFMCLPIRFKGTSAAPVRAVAILDG